MKRYDPGHFEMICHEEAQYVTYADAQADKLAFARRVAYATIRWYIHRDIPATNPKAEDEAINAIIAEAEKSCS